MRTVEIPGRTVRLTIKTVRTAGRTVRIGTVKAEKPGKTVQEGTSTAPIPLPPGQLAGYAPANLSEPVREPGETR